MRRVIFKHLMQEQIGQGGPVNGDDIATYHLFPMDPDFKLGQKIMVDDEEIDTKDYIWPICLPKNDDDYVSDGVELNEGIVVGWLDAPPVFDTNRRLLGRESDSINGIRFVGRTHRKIH